MVSISWRAMKCTGAFRSVPLGFYSENEIFWGTMLVPNRSPGLLFGSMGHYLAVTLWRLSESEKHLTRSLPWTFSVLKDICSIGLQTSDQTKNILKNTLFPHKRGGQVTAQLLGNMATKDMVWKYLMCTSLEDVQKIQWNSRNFSNPKIVLQCFKFGAQESKRIARFAMCWMFCVF